MNRRADVIVYGIVFLLFVGAASLWWLKLFPSSGKEVVLLPGGQGCQGPGQAPLPEGSEKDVFSGEKGLGQIEASEDLCEELIYVHVAGAVEAPGVYELKKGQRVYEAIEKAVPLEDAHLDFLNLASLLEDQDKIYLPKKGEFENSSGAPAYGSEGSVINPPKATFPLNINRATAAELELLPGIGPAKARAIIEYRDEKGPFARTQDLKKVSGIGDVTFSKLESLVTVK